MFYICDNKVFSARRDLSSGRYEHCIEREYGTDKLVGLVNTPDGYVRSCTDTGNINTLAVGRRNFFWQQQNGRFGNENYYFHLRKFSDASDEELGLTDEELCSNIQSEDDLSEDSILSSLMGVIPSIEDEDFMEEKVESEVKFYGSYIYDTSEAFILLTTDGDIYCGTMPDPYYSENDYTPRLKMEENIDVIDELNVDYETPPCLPSRSFVYSCIQLPVKISSMAVSSKHVLFVTIDGQLYSCGNNEQGQLGLGDLENRDAPMLVPLLDYITSISCWSNTSAIVCHNGNVHICGSGIYSSENIMKFRQIPQIENITHVTVSPTKIVCYTTGSNTFCIIGSKLPECEGKFYFTKECINLALKQIKSTGNITSYHNSIPINSIKVFRDKEELFLLICEDKVFAIGNNRLDDTTDITKFIETKSTIYIANGDYDSSSDYRFLGTKSAR